MRTMGLMGLAVLLAVPPLRAQQVAADTVPENVVQRFVDGANRRDVSEMMMTVAPEAVFSVLPDGEILASGRDKVRAFYERVFAQLKAGFSVDISKRISAGAFVIDHEVFHQEGQAKPTGDATWVYWVAGGLIRHAWSLESPPKSP
jgi:hypothetical protein